MSEIAVIPFLRRLLLILSISLPACLASALMQPAEDILAQVARANALLQEGKFTEARKIYESLLPDLRPKASEELGDCLLALSEIAIAEGRYDAALVLARESADAFQTIGNTDRAAKAHNNAGLATMDAGNYPEAVSELSSALRLSKQTRTSIMILNNLGDAYYYQAKYAESFRAYDDAVQRLEHSADAARDPSMRKLTLFNLAVLYQRLGDEQRALNVYQGLQQSPSGLASGDLGHLYANLGIIYRHLGDPQKALDAFRKAERFYEREHDVDGELGVRMDTGILLAFDLIRPDQALKVFTDLRARAEEAKNQRTAMQALLYLGQALYRMGRFADAKREFEAALIEAGKLGTTEEQWKALYGLGRIAEKNNQSGIAEAHYRDAISRIESIRSKIQLAPLKAGFLADKRDVYDALISLLVIRNDPATAFEYMERSRARVFQDRFSGAGPAPGAISLRSIQKLVDPSTAMVEFWISADRIAAVWITRDSTGLAQRQLSPADAQELMGLTGRLPDILGENWQTDVARLNALLPQHLVPLADSRYSHLLIVPDGLLSLIPYELMPTEGGKLLLESHDLTYLPSAVLLLRSPVPRANRVRLPWEQQLVAFGDPAIDQGGGDSIVALDKKALDRLPGSADEIRQIAAMSNGRARIYLGADDRKQAFIEASRVGAALLHVSTHAVADLDNPERSRLLFAPAQAGQPNDFLFLKELYDVNLQGVNLAVLSACDTEQGKLVPGEGIQSFSRALLASGARSALTTLWRVPDQPTREFVNQFYFFLLNKHKSKSDALRLAKLRFLHSGTALSHPRYWAAFVLNGEGTAKIPTFLPWQAIVLPVPLAVLLAVVSWHLARASRTRRLSATGLPPPESSSASGRRAAISSPSQPRE
jgi:CHAT domain-containing protein/tetratricopeptide (TPR) repeat protein